MLGQAGTALPSPRQGHSLSWQPHALHSRGVWNPFASQEAVFSQQDWSSTEWQGADPAPRAICSLFIFLHLSITSQINALQCGRAGDISQHTGRKPSLEECQLPIVAPLWVVLSYGTQHAIHGDTRPVLHTGWAAQESQAAASHPHASAASAAPHSPPPAAHVHTCAHTCTPAPHAWWCPQACQHPHETQQGWEPRAPPYSSPSAGGHVWRPHLSTQPLPSVLLPVSAGAGGPGSHPAGCTGAAFPLLPSSSQLSIPLCMRLCPPWGPSTAPLAAGTCLLLPPRAQGLSVSSSAQGTICRR